MRLVTHFRMILGEKCGYRTKRGLAHLASVPYHPCHILVWFSASDAFVFKNPLQRLFCSEWIGEGTTSREEYPVASQMIKEHGVPGLHRPVGEQHIDLTRGIKVKCACIEDRGKDVFPLGPDELIGRVKDSEQVHIAWAGAGRRVTLHAG